MEKWTVQKGLEAYHRIRDRDHLQRGLFRQSKNTPEERACALGAFFQADSYSEALTRCTNDMLPPWLVAYTPNFFDSQKRAESIAWADRLYGRGGIAERADRLTPKQRAKLWERAEQLLVQEMNTNSCVQKEINGNKFVAASKVCAHMHWFDAESVGLTRYANTILDVVEDALQEAGV